MTLGYDLAGHLTLETYPSGTTITTTFDQAGRTNGVTGVVGGQSKTYVSSMSYTAHGETTAIKLGGIGISLYENASYNGRLQPVTIGSGTSSSDYSKLRLDYSYGTAPTANNGNLQTQTITVPGLTVAQSYTYDNLNRLTIAQEANGTNWKQTFTYDRYGNRNFDLNNTTSNVLGPNPTIDQTTNRFSAGQGYSYDTSGNLTTEPSKSYGYDAENHLVNFNNGSTTYTYDGEGLRVTKTTGASPTVFVYDVSGRLVAEYGGSQGTNSGTSYLITDHLGSTRLVTDSQGNVRARHDYLPFGDEISAGIGGRTTGQGYGVSDDTRQKFTSKERDAESGLDYYEARYFSSMQGRFTSTDPVVITADRLIDPQEINLYNYGRCNPLRFTDPTGEDINDSSLKDNKEYQRWKAAFLATKAGKALWDKYSDHKYQLTITMGENKGGKFGAETKDYKFDSQGNLTGATIVLGKEFGKEVASGTYEIGSSLTPTDQHGADIGREARAVAYLAHEFGHVEDAERSGGTLWQRQDQLLGENKQGFENQGQAWFNTSEYQKVVSQLGDTPANVNAEREIRAERETIPVLQQYYGRGAGHGSLPNRVKQAIQNYQKAHP